MGNFRFVGESLLGIERSERHQHCLHSIGRQPGHAHVAHGARKKLPPAITIFPIPPDARYRWTRCWNGRCAIAKACRAQLLESLPERLQTKQARPLELGNRYAQIEREFEARAEHFRAKGLKHGSTGLVVESFKSAGSGTSAQLEAEYAIDTPAIRASNGILEQISRELGQYDEYRKGDRPLVIVQNNNTQVNLSVLSDDELAAYRAVLAKLAAGGNPALGPGSGDTPTA